MNIKIFGDGWWYWLYNTVLKLHTWKWLRWQMLRVLSHTHKNKTPGKYQFSRKLKETTETNSEAIQMLEFVNKHFEAAFYNWSQQYKGRYIHNGQKDKNCRWRNRNYKEESNGSILELKNMVPKKKINILFIICIIYSLTF